MPQMLTVEEVATTLRVTPQTIWRYLKSGKLAGTKIGKRYLITPEAVERLQQPPAPPQDTSGSAEA